MIYSGFVAEWLKYRRSGIMWLAVFGTLVSNIILMSIFIYLPDNGLLIESREATWDGWLAFHYNAISIMLLPMFIVIICALAVHMERTADMWKVMHMLPVSPHIIFLTKLTVVTLIFMGAHFLFVLTLTILPFTGILTLYGTPDLLLISGLMGATIGGSLGIIGIVYLVSYFSSNFVIPLFVGIIGFVLAQILIDNQSFLVHFFPFSLPAVGSSQLLAQNSLNAHIMAWSGTIMAVCSLIGVLALRNKTWLPR